MSDHGYPEGTDRRGRPARREAGGRWPAARPPLARHPSTPDDFTLLAKSFAGDRSAGPPTSAAALEAAPRLIAES